MTHNCLSSMALALHAMLWSHIGILIHIFAAEHRSTAGPLLPSQCSCGMILLTLYSMVWDWRVSTIGTMVFFWHKQLDPFFYSNIFSFHLFLFMVFHWGAEVFRLMWCNHSLPGKGLHCRPILIIIKMMIVAIGGPNSTQV